MKDKGAVRKDENAVREVRKDIQLLRSKICINTNELGLDIDSFHSISHYLHCIEKLIFYEF